MPSPVPNFEAGIDQSASVRSRKAEGFLWSLRTNIIALAKAGELGSTLKERAAQLTARGVRTTRLNPIDAFNLSPALRKLGADANAIKGWLNKAIDAADEYGVEESEMIHQLWHEWFYHEAVCWVEHGIEFSANSDRPFKFQPVRPFHWIPHDERGVLRATSFVSASPPAARLVYALFGMFQMQMPLNGGYAPRAIEPDPDLPPGVVGANNFEPDFLPEDADDIHHSDTLDAARAADGLEGQFDRFGAPLEGPRERAYWRRLRRSKREPL